MYMYQPQGSLPAAGLVAHLYFHIQFGHDVRSNSPGNGTGRRIGDILCRDGTAKVSWLQDFRRELICHDDIADCQHRN